MTSFVGTILSVIVIIYISIQADGRCSRRHNKPMDQAMGDASFLLSVTMLQVQKSDYRHRKSTQRIGDQIPHGINDTGCLHIGEENLIH